ASTGVAVQIDTAQPTLGGDDTIIGGAGRDVQFGGAGADSLTGNAGDDLMQGDHGLLTRELPLATGQWTFESKDITEGGDDVLIGDTLADPDIGRDFMIGGIGNDTFSMSIGTDVVAGEFLRVRFEKDQAGEETITSFLTPAVKDLDLLVQITLGVNFASEASAIVGPPEGVNVDFGLPGDVRISITDRMDLIFLLEDMLTGAMMEGLLSEQAASEVAGLQGFRMLTPEILATFGVDPAVLEQEGDAPAEPAAQPADPNVVEPSLPNPEEAQNLFGVTPEATETAAAAPQGGWRMAGWRLGSSDTVSNG
ncbi:MAG: hypothetical protein VX181_18585, partial [Pseudomonadota bacterium]|nr:hypothetical protein [Pseudomonadota bacterium]